MSGLTRWESTARLPVRGVRAYKRNVPLQLLDLAETAESTLSLLLFCLASVANGYPSFKGRIPNGENVPHPCKPNYLWKGVGHQNPLGGGAPNPFGVDFKNQGYRWTTALCAMDSDGDGLTNGQELGDPNCVWTPEQVPQAITGLSHPGVCNPFDSAACQESNSWVSCELEEFVCDAINEPDTRNMTIRFPPTSVPNTETNYFCMTFDLPSDAPYHLVAHKPHIDNAQVMHHILLFGCDDPTEVEEISQPRACGMEAESGCNSVIALWAVGYAGFCLHPDTGFQIGAGGYTRVKMEFHWNNPELRSDYTDSSGLTLYYTPRLRQYNSATFTIGQTVIEIPPRQPSVEISGSCTSACSREIIQQPLYIQAALNHMHYLGRKAKIEIFRNGNLVMTIADDQRFSYDSPALHEFPEPVEVLPGDELRTTCTYSSQDKTKTVFYGDGTSSEMCYSFLFVYPSEALPFTTWCTGVRSQSSCDAYTGRPIEGCDYFKFSNFTHPETAEFVAQLFENCDTFGSCRPECHALMTTIADHPCLHGDAYHFMKYVMTQSHQGTLVLAMLDSCREQLEGNTQQPECPRCPDCNGDTGAAALAVPEVISVAILACFALILASL